MNKPDSQDIDAAIAQARTLVAKARQVVGETERYLAERGFTRESCLEDLRRLGGEAAVRKAEAEVEEKLREIEDEVQRSRSVSPTAKPIIRRLARRGGLV